MPADASRDLLFGLLALQVGLIDQARLVSAFQAWTLDKGRLLADHLEGRGDLDGDDRKMIDALVARHLKKNGGDTEKSLAALNVGLSTRKSLGKIGGPQVEQTLGQVGSGSDPVREREADRTGSYAVGSVTSQGQRFRLLRPHAQGGLGAVFVALDGELNREVALKQILDRHADDPVSRQRFLIEAEITGGLEHPGVVPVYGLGTYDGGRPYYAMRFIKGDNFKETIASFHADESFRADPGKRSLELRKLLRRFVDICNAIDYAHTRGVLHRDIKPANVIVGKHGETLVVDWGLAKVMGRTEHGTTSDKRTLMPSSASGSAETLPGSALGTPSYMSPEQASGDIEHLGSRSDVYSLGATLYCLLTGKPPFLGDDLGAVLRAVQKGEFPSPRTADPTIDRALEAVCLKAMALKPEDRYATPKGLADDVERWAADEPVTAWREPFARRARRWGRRNRTAVTAGAVAVLALLFGTAAVLAVQTTANGVLKEANTALGIANAKERKAHADLSRANTALAAAKDREAARFELAMEAIKLFHGEVGNDLVLKADSFKPLRDRLLKSAAGFYNKLEGLLRDQSDPPSRVAMGNAYFELGELTAKIGDKPAALEAHRKGLEVRRILVSEPTTNSQDRGEVAKSLHATAVLLHETGQSSEALARFEEARDLLEELPPSGPGSDGRRALLGRVYRGIGVVLATSVRTAAAMAAYQRSVETLSRLVDENPTVADFRRDLAISHNKIGILLAMTGEPVDGLAAFRRALTIRQKLADDNPTVAEFRNELAISHNNVSLSLSKAGKPMEALEELRQALATYRKLIDDNPAVTDFRSEQANSLNNIGFLLTESGELVKALGSLRAALAIFQKLVDDNPTVIDFRYRLALTLENIGDVLSQTGGPVEALGSYRRALAIYQKLVDDNPAITNYRNHLANSHTNVADVQHTLGRIVEARDAYGRAIAIREALVEASPDFTDFRSGLAFSVRRLGLVRLAAGDAAGAVAEARRASALFEGLPSRTGGEWYELACCHAALAAAAGREGSGISTGDGGVEADKAMALLRRAVADGYRNADAMAREIALAPLRDRPDFRLLMLDLAFPADPFAN